jgi:NAD(P)-dependent dehydrogenase (short-subunit alcohol dehydrogenase family)
VKAERGTLDIVFAKCRGGKPAGTRKNPSEHIDETFDTNVKRAILTVQKALPLMSQDASIIVTGSSAGTTGAPRWVRRARRPSLRSLRFDAWPILQKSERWRPFWRRRIAAS